MRIAPPFREGLRISSASPSCQLLFSPSLCCRIVLKNTLTAGGAGVASLERRVPAAWSCGMEGARSGSNVSRSGALVRLCRTRAQASRPWIHAASRPCGTRADLVATSVAAQAAPRSFSLLSSLCHIACSTGEGRTRCRSCGRLSAGRGRPPQTLPERVLCGKPAVKEHPAA